MISEVVMPQMGADMKEGTILRWLKSEGDRVERGEVIAEIETDKANVEIEAYASGVLRRILSAEGATLPVGTVMALIGDQEDDITAYEGSGGQTSAPEPRAEQPAASAGATTQAPAPSAEPSAGQPRPAEAGAVAPAATAATGPAATAGDGDEGVRLRASPVARQLAQELGVDLVTVQGTGPDGRIVRRDVEAAASRKVAARQAAPEAPPAQEVPVAPRPEPAPAAAPGRMTEVPLSRMRQTIARRMQQSKQQAPHYYLSIDVDMTEAVAFIDRANASLVEGGPITINDMVVLATSRALLKHPRFNAWLEGDTLKLHERVEMGVAVSLQEGLLVVTVRDAARKGLQQISVEVRDLARRAREGRLQPEEFTGSTFTISNAGMFGVDVLLAIINPPQVGILGVGKMQQKPVVRDGQIVVRQMMTVTLSADHRATDGADGARFLQTLRSMLEQPELMLV